MKTALVLGGGYSLWDDLAAYKGPIDGVVACNDAGAHVGHALHAWVSLHPEKFRLWEGKRTANGIAAPVEMFVSHRQPSPGVCGPLDLITAHQFDGVPKTGSSGMFAAKVALDDLEYDRAVLCGIPIEKAPHFFNQKDWQSADNYRKQWERIPEEWAARIRSMSGWTREYFGHPDRASPPLPRVRRAKPHDTRPRSPQGATFYGPHAASTPPLLEAGEEIKPGRQNRRR